MVVKKIIEINPQLVNSENLDDNPGPFCMSFGFDLSIMLQSIKNIGMVNAPLLLEKGDGRLAIIAGYRRIQALKVLKWKKIPCRIFSESQLSPLECLLLSLHDNLVTRQLNDVEKGMVLSRLASYLPKTTILEQYMPLLNLPSHESTLLVFQRLERKLDEKIKEYLARGRLSLQAAKMILEMDSEARSHVAHLIAKLKFNINQQKQFLDLLVDISFANKQLVSEFLKEYPLEKMYSSYDCLNNPQKVKAALQFLRTKRFPSLLHAERNFKKAISNLTLPNGVRIDFPPFFEASSYRLEISFNNGKELKKKMEVLTGNGHLENLGDPLERHL